MVRVRLARARHHCDERANHLPVGHKDGGIGSWQTRPVPDRYGPDVLAQSTVAPSQQIPRVEIESGLVVECADSGFCGAVIRLEKTAEGLAVLLEDRHGARRLFPLRPAAFLFEGHPATLVPPPPAQAKGAKRSASGSVYVAGLSARVAQANRIWVEGIHDAELVERVWGHDLRVEGIVVEPLHGADDLVAALSQFGPAGDRRVGVLLDHLVPGSKESRIAQAARAAFDPYVEILGHPYVDVWQTIKPTVLGIEAWPHVPPGLPWKAGVIAALGWRMEEREAWDHILGSVRGYGDLEPGLLGPVEQLIDFVTADR